MRTIVKFFGLAFAICVASAPISEAFASKKKAGSLYRGRTITILVGYGAGGTYGRTSLLLAEHLGKYIPRKPNLVVQHMPGAGGIKATNYAANVMPPNGLNFLMPPEMSVASAVLRPSKVKYAPQNFQWLGRVFGQNNTVVVRRDAGVKKWEDLKGKTVMMASSGKGSPTFLIPRLMNGLLGTKFKIVSGYKGSKRMQMSVEQKETQGAALGWIAWESGRPHWFKDGWDANGNSVAIPLAQSGYTPQKGLEKVPMIRNLAKTETDKQIADLLGSASVIGRALVLPPKAPKWLTPVLRKSFDKVVKDKKFIKDAYKRRLEVNPISGAEISQIVAKLMSAPKAVQEKGRKMIFGK
tara:strand:+ start:139 stop:1197 length:1059 start_codon:yes stop_codon:yes gene_type:complete